jgi:hypothetical protein
VERHMRICFNIDSTFEDMVTVSPSGPLLSEAAYSIMAQRSFNVPFFSQCSSLSYRFLSFVACVSTSCSGASADPRLSGGFLARNSLKMRNTKWLALKFLFLNIFNYNIYILCNLFSLNFNWFRTRYSTGFHSQIVIGEQDNILNVEAKDQLIRFMRSGLFVGTDGEDYHGG